jgi:hypothetical protein
MVAKALETDADWTGTSGAVGAGVFLGRLAAG